MQNKLFVDTDGNPLVIGSVYVDSDCDICTVVTFDGGKVIMNYNKYGYIPLGAADFEGDCSLSLVCNSQVRISKPADQNVGCKFDSGKTQWWYMPIKPMQEVISVLEYGDTKYPAEDGCNWKRVPDAKKRYYSALMRHITAWFDGEKYDKESGKHHLAHAATNCLFLLWFDMNEEMQ